MSPRASVTSAERPPTPQTAEKILRAAERLFAKEGFDRVTLRQIARESDQKNVAAVQYHFGSKEGLLGAIVESHRSEIDEARRLLLGGSEIAGRGNELAALIEILVHPLADKLDTPSGRAYLRIQAQGLSTESMRPATRIAVQRIRQSLGKGLGNLESAGEDPHRSRFALLLLFHALADRAQQEEVGRARRADRAAFKTSLSRSIEGLFLAHSD